MSHIEMEKIIEAEELDNKNSVKEVLEWLQKYFDEPNPKIHLDDEIVLELMAEEGDRHYDILKMRGHLSEDYIRQFQLVPGEKIIINREKCTTQLDASFPRLDAALCDLGIPPLQILMIEANADFHFVELSGDEDILQFERQQSEPEESVKK